MGRPIDFAIPALLLIIAGCGPAQNENGVDAGNVDAKAVSDLQDGNNAEVDGTIATEAGPGQRDGADSFPVADASTVDANAVGVVDGADATMDSRVLPDAGELPGAPKAFSKCLENLPPAIGYQEVQEKRSADGTTNVVLLLDTMHDFGTSGTKPFHLLRLGVERVGGVSACIDGAAALRYLGSHHNYMDQAQGSSDGIIYSVQLNLDYGPPVQRSESIGAGAGAEMLWGPLPLMSIRCTSSNADRHCVFRD